MPITKTIWWGKVGAHDFGAYTVIVPVTSVPIAIFYCSSKHKFVEAPSLELLEHLLASPVVRELYISRTNNK